MSRVLICHLAFSVVYVCSHFPTFMFSVDARGPRSGPVRPSSRSECFANAWRSCFSRAISPRATSSSFFLIHSELCSFFSVSPALLFLFGFFSWHYILLVRVSSFSVANWVAPGNGIYSQLCSTVANLRGRGQAELIKSSPE